MPKELVAVTGMGCVCGEYSSLPELMAGLHAPRRAPAVVTRAAARHPKGFPLFAIPDALAAMLTQEAGTLSVGMALMAAREALTQAQLDPAQLDPVSTGVCLGSSSGASLNFLEYYLARRSGQKTEPGRFATILTHNPGPSLARYLAIGSKTTMPRSAVRPGPAAVTITNACTSGADAIGLGLSWLRQGLCEVVIAGGTDELCLSAVTGFSRLLILDPALCRPFDADHNGLNLGEGAGVMVLERLEHALQRGQRPLALLNGYGTAADAYHLTAPHPQGKGLLAAAGTALADAGVTPADLAFINAHGTGTRENDRAEAALFAQYFPSTPISATKGGTGHTLGAAGAIEAAVTVACLRQGSIPPSLGFATPHPELGLSPVSRVTPIARPHALSQSLAFGGNNSALVFSTVRP